MIMTMIMMITAVTSIKDLMNLGMAEYDQHHRPIIYQLIDQSLQSRHAE